MAIKFSAAVRNARISQLITAIGASPLLRFYTGSAPANITDAATGTLLAELTLPAVWLDTPSGGVATQLGSWQTASATATGTPGYFRFYDSTGTTAHVQGVTPGDMLGSPTALITSGALVTVGPGYTFTDGNA